MNNTKASVAAVLVWTFLVSAAVAFHCDAGESRTYRMLHHAAQLSRPDAAQMSHNKMKLTCLERWEDVYLTRLTFFSDAEHLPLHVPRSDNRRKITVLAKFFVNGTVESFSELLGAEHRHPRDERSRDDEASDAAARDLVYELLHQFHIPSGAVRNNHTHHSFSYADARISLAAHHHRSSRGHKTLLHARSVVVVHLHKHHQLAAMTESQCVDCAEHAHVDDDSPHMTRNPSTYDMLGVPSAVVVHPTLCRPVDLSNVHLDWPNSTQIEVAVQAFTSCTASRETQGVEVVLAPHCAPFRYGTVAEYNEYILACYSSIVVPAETCMLTLSIAPYQNATAMAQNIEGHVSSRIVAMLPPLHFTVAVKRSVSSAASGVLFYDMHHYRRSFQCVGEGNLHSVFYTYNPRSAYTMLYREFIDAEDDLASLSRFSHKDLGSVGVGLRFAAFLDCYPHLAWDFAHATILKRPDSLQHDDTDVCLRGAKVLGALQSDEAEKIYEACASRPQLCCLEPLNIHALTVRRQQLFSLPLVKALVQLVDDYHLDTFAAVDVIERLVLDDATKVALFSKYLVRYWDEIRNVTSAPTPAASTSAEEQRVLAHSFLKDMKQDRMRESPERRNFLTAANAGNLFDVRIGPSYGFDKQFGGDFLGFRIFAKLKDQLYMQINRGGSFRVGVDLVNSAGAEAYFFGLKCKLLGIDANGGFSQHVDIRNYLPSFGCPEGSDAKNRQYSDLGNLPWGVYQPVAALLGWGSRTSSSSRHFEAQGSINDCFDQYGCDFFLCVENVLSCGVAGYFKAVAIPTCQLQKRLAGSDVLQTMNALCQDCIRKGILEVVSKNPADVCTLVSVQFSGERFRECLKSSGLCDMSLDDWIAYAKTVENAASLMQTLARVLMTCPNAAVANVAQGTISSIVGSITGKAVPYIMDKGVLLLTKTMDEAAYIANRLKQIQQALQFCDLKCFCNMINLPKASITQLKSTIASDGVPAATRQSALRKCVSDHLRSLHTCEITSTLSYKLAEKCVDDIVKQSAPNIGNLYFGQNIGKRLLIFAIKSISAKLLSGSGPASEICNSAVNCLASRSVDQCLQFAIPCYMPNLLTGLQSSLTALAVKALTDTQCDAAFAHCCAAHTVCMGKGQSAGQCNNFFFTCLFADVANFASAACSLMEPATLWTYGEALLVQWYIKTLEPVFVAYSLVQFSQECVCIKQPFTQSQPVNDFYVTYTWMGKTRTLTSLSGKDAPSNAGGCFPLPGPMTTGVGVVVRFQAGVILDPGMKYNVGFGAPRKPQYPPSASAKFSVTVYLTFGAWLKVGGGVGVGLGCISVSITVNMIVRLEGIKASLTPTLEMGLSKPPIRTDFYVVPSIVLGAVQVDMSLEFCIEIDLWIGSITKCWVPYRGTIAKTDGVKIDFDRFLESGHGSKANPPPIIGGIVAERGVVSIIKNQIVCEMRSNPVTSCPTSNTRVRTVATHFSGVRHSAWRDVFLQRTVTMDIPPGTPPGARVSCEFELEACGTATASSASTFYDPVPIAAKVNRGPDQDDAPYTIFGRNPCFNYWLTSTPLTGLKSMTASLYDASSNVLVATKSNPTVELMCFDLPLRYPTFVLEMNIAANNGRTIVVRSKTMIVDDLPPIATNIGVGCSELELSYRGAIRSTTLCFQVDLIPRRSGIVGTALVIKDLATSAVVANANLPFGRTENRPLEVRRQLSTQGTLAHARYYTVQLQVMTGAKAAAWYPPFYLLVDLKPPAPGNARVINPKNLRPLREYTAFNTTMCIGWTGYDDDGVGLKMITATVDCNGVRVGAGKWDPYYEPVKVLCMPIVPQGHGAMCTTSITAADKLQHLRVDTLSVQVYLIPPTVHIRLGCGETIPRRPNLWRFKDMICATLNVTDAVFALSALSVYIVNTATRAELFMYQFQTPTLTSFVFSNVGMQDTQYDLVAYATNTLDLVGAGKVTFRVDTSLPFGAVLLLNQNLLTHDASTSRNVSLVLKQFACQGEPCESSGLECTVENETMTMLVVPLWTSVTNTSGVATFTGVAQPPMDGWLQCRAFAVTVAGNMGVLFSVAVLVDSTPPVIPRDSVVVQWVQNSLSITCGTLNPPPPPSEDTPRSNATNVSHVCVPGGNTSHLRVINAFHGAFEGVLPVSLCTDPMLVNCSVLRSVTNATRSTVPVAFSNRHAALTLCVNDAPRSRSLIALAHCATGTLPCSLRLNTLAWSASVVSSLRIEDKFGAVETDGSCVRGLMNRTDFTPLQCPIRIAPDTTSPAFVNTNLPDLKLNLHAGMMWFTSQKTRLTVSSALPITIFGQEWLPKIPESGVKDPESEELGIDCIVTVNGNRYAFKGTNGLRSVWLNQSQVGVYTTALNVTCSNRVVKTSTMVQLEVPVRPVLTAWIPLNVSADAYVRPFDNIRIAPRWPPERGLPSSCMICPGTYAFDLTACVEVPCAASVTTRPPTIPPGATSRVLYVTTIGTYATGDVFAGNSSTIVTSNFLPRASKCIVDCCSQASNKTCDVDCTAGAIDSPMSISVNNGPKFSVPWFSIPIEDDTGMFSITIVDTTWAGQSSFLTMAAVPLAVGPRVTYAVAGMFEIPGLGSALFPGLVNVSVAPSAKLFGATFQVTCDATTVPGANITAASTVFDVRGYMECSVMAVGIGRCGLGDSAALPSTTFAVLNPPQFVSCNSTIVNKTHACVAASVASQSPLIRLDTIARNTTTSRSWTRVGGRLQESLLFCAQHSELPQRATHISFDATNFVNQTVSCTLDAALLVPLELQVSLYLSGNGSSKPATQWSDSRRVCMRVAALAGPISAIPRRLWWSIFAQNDTDIELRKDNLTLYIPLTTMNDTIVDACGGLQGDALNLDIENYTLCVVGTTTTGASVNTFACYNFSYIAAAPPQMRFNDDVRAANAAPWSSSAISYVPDARPCLVVVNRTLLVEAGLGDVGAATFKPISYHPTTGVYCFDAPWYEDPFLMSVRAVSRSGLAGDALTLSIAAIPTPAQGTLTLLDGRKATLFGLDTWCMKVALLLNASLVHSASVTLFSGSVSVSEAVDVTAAVRAGGDFCIDNTSIGNTATSVRSDLRITTHANINSTIRSNTVVLVRRPASVSGDSTGGDTPAGTGGVSGAGPRIDSFNATVQFPNVSAVVANYTVDTTFYSGVTIEFCVSQRGGTCDITGGMWQNISFNATTGAVLLRVGDLPMAANLSVDTETSVSFRYTDDIGYPAICDPCLVFVLPSPPSPPTALHVHESHAQSGEKAVPVIAVGAPTVFVWDLGQNDQSGTVAFEFDITTGDFMNQTMTVARVEVGDQNVTSSWNTTLVIPAAGPNPSNPPRHGDPIRICIVSINAVGGRSGKQCSNASVDITGPAAPRVFDGWGSCTQYSYQRNQGAVAVNWCPVSTDTLDRIVTFNITCSLYSGNSLVWSSGVVSQTDQLPNVLTIPTATALGQRSRCSVCAVDPYGRYQCSWTNGSTIVTNPAAYNTDVWYYEEGPPRAGQLCVAGTATPCAVDETAEIVNDRNQVGVTWSPCLGAVMAKHTACVSCAGCNETCTTLAYDASTFVFNLAPYKLQEGSIAELRIRCVTVGKFSAEMIRRVQVRRTPVAWRTPLLPSRRQPRLPAACFPVSVANQSATPYLVDCAACGQHVGGLSGSVVQVLTSEVPLWPTNATTDRVKLRRMLNTYTSGDSYVVEASADPAGFMLTAFVSHRVESQVNFTDIPFVVVSRNDTATFFCCMDLSRCPSHNVTTLLTVTTQSRAFVNASVSAVLALEPSLADLMHAIISVNSTNSTNGLQAAPPCRLELATTEQGDMSISNNCPRFGPVNGVDVANTSTMMVWFSDPTIPPIRLNSTDVSNVTIPTFQQPKLEGRNTTVFIAQLDESGQVIASGNRTTVVTFTPTALSQEYTNVTFNATHIEILASWSSYVSFAVEMQLYVAGGDVFHNSSFVLNESLWQAIPGANATDVLWGMNITHPDAQSLFTVPHTIMPPTEVPLRALARFVILPLEGTGRCCRQLDIPFTYLQPAVAFEIRGPRSGVLNLFSPTYSIVVVDSQGRATCEQDGNTTLVVTTSAASNLLLYSNSSGPLVNGSSNLTVFPFITDDRSSQFEVNAILWDTQSLDRKFQKSLPQVVVALSAPGISIRNGDVFAATATYFVAIEIYDSDGLVAGTDRTTKVQLLCSTCLFPLEGDVFTVRDGRTTIPVSFASSMYATYNASLVFNVSNDIQRRVWLVNRTVTVSYRYSGSMTVSLLNPTREIPLFALFSVAIAFTEVETGRVMDVVADNITLFSHSSVLQLIPNSLNPPGTYSMVITADVAQVVVRATGRNAAIVSAVVALAGSHRRPSNCTAVIEPTSEATFVGDILSLRLTVLDQVGTSIPLHLLELYMSCNESISYVAVHVNGSTTGIIKVVAIRSTAGRTAVNLLFACQIRVGPASVQAAQSTIPMTLLPSREVFQLADYCFTYPSLQVSQSVANITWVPPGAGVPIALCARLSGETLSEPLAVHHAQCTSLTVLNDTNTTLSLEGLSSSESSLAAILSQADGQLSDRTAATVTVAFNCTDIHALPLPSVTFDVDLRKPVDVRIKRLPLMTVVTEVTTATAELVDDEGVAIDGALPYRNALSITCESKNTTASVVCVFLPQSLDFSYTVSRPGWHRVEARVLLRSPGGNVTTTGFFVVEVVSPLELHDAVATQVSHALPRSHLFFDVSIFDFTWTAIEARVGEEQLRVVSQDGRLVDIVQRNLTTTDVDNNTLQLEATPLDPVASPDLEPETMYVLSLSLRSYATTVGLRIRWTYPSPDMQLVNVTRRFSNDDNEPIAVQLLVSPNSSEALYHRYQPRVVDFAGRRVENPWAEHATSHLQLDAWDLQVNALLLLRNLLVYRQWEFSAMTLGGMDAAWCVYLDTINASVCTGPVELVSDRVVSETTIAAPNFTSVGYTWTVAIARCEVKEGGNVPVNTAASRPFYESWSVHCTCCSNRAVQVLCPLNSTGAPCFATLHTDAAFDDAHVCDVVAKAPQWYGNSTLLTSRPENHQSNLVRLALLRIPRAGVATEFVQLEYRDVASCDSDNISAPFPMSSWSPNIATARSSLHVASRLRATSSNRSLHVAFSRPTQPDAGLEEMSLGILGHSMYYTRSYVVRATPINCSVNNIWIRSTDNIQVYCRGHTAMSMPFDALCNGEVCGVFPGEANYSSLLTWDFAAGPFLTVTMTTRTATKVTVATSKADGAGIRLLVVARDDPDVVLHNESVHVFNLSTHPGTVRITLSSTTNTTEVAEAMTRVMSGCNNTCVVMNETRQIDNGTIEMLLLLINTTDEDALPLSAAAAEAMKCTYDIHTDCSKPFFTPLVIGLFTAGAVVLIALIVAGILVYRRRKAAQEAERAAKAAASLSDIYSPTDAQEFDEIAAPKTELEEEMDLFFDSHAPIMNKLEDVEIPPEPVVDTYTATVFGTQSADDTRVDFIRQHRADTAPSEDPFGAAPAPVALEPPRAKPSRKRGASLKRGAGEAPPPPRPPTPPPDEDDVDCILGDSKTGPPKKSNDSDEDDLFDL